MVKIQDSSIISVEKVGTAKGGDVFEAVTNGGLVIIELRKNGGEKETLACGPHRGIARFIAECNDSTIVFNELQKSETFIEDFHLVPEYKVLSNRFRNLKGA